jgi:hypothetical protein
MATLFGMFPFLKTLFADSGYQGPKFAKALAKVLPAFTAPYGPFCLAANISTHRSAR